MSAAAAAARRARTSSSGLGRSGRGRRCELLRARGRGGARRRRRPPAVELRRRAPRRDGLAQLEGVARGRQVARACPREAPVIAAARERGLPVLGEVELAWRLLPNEFIAVTGTNGKTTTTELIGHIHREAGAAGRGGRQRRHGAELARRRRSTPDAVVVCEVVLVPARGHRRVRARGRRAAQPRARPPRPPRHVRGLPRGQAARLRPPGQRRRRRRAARPRRRGPRRLRAARVLRRRARGRAVRPRRALWWADEPLSRRRDPPARRPQPPQRDGRGGDLPGARDRRRRRARGPADVRAASSTASRRSPTIDGVLYVNDSKATNVASTLVALAALRRAGAPDPRRRRARARTSRRCASRVRRALRRRLPDRRGRPRAGRRRSAASRCGDARARASPRRAPRRARARSCCSRRRARASTSSRTSRPAGRHFKELVG